ncbi:hypothetical protein IV454_23835 [Massilia antarctica]|uniref:Uncharacterized protein n=1 Tax=Massilia antarctica TaxID=2765360 RepID=A0AA48WBN4_9BURK|nr:hypothetical protein [Massilia antarctica]QPI48534.1 hypothetical protein IV454_23835 [Massilia antarctica]
MTEIEMYKDSDSVNPPAFDALEQIVGYRLLRSYRALLSAADALWPDARVFNFVDCLSSEFISRPSLQRRARRAGGVP